jgi:hypothetical protein
VPGAAEAEAHLPRPKKRRVTAPLPRLSGNFARSRSTGAGALINMSYARSQAARSAAVLRNAIADDLVHGFGPLLTQFNEWLLVNKDWLNLKIGHSIRGPSTWLKALPWEKIGVGVKHAWDWSR